MRKLLFIILFSIFLSGCTEENQIYIENDTFGLHHVNNTVIDNGYLYYCDNNQYAKLKRMNLATGNITYVCPDPLCEHTDTDCIFYGMRAWTVYNSTVYYEREFHTAEGKGENKTYHNYHGYVCYDLKEGKTTELQKYYENHDQPSGTVTSVRYLKELFINQYRYYYDCTYNKADMTTSYRLLRMNLHDGATDVLADSSTDMTPTERFLFILNDRIYFYDGSLLFHTSLDYDIADRVIIAEGAYSDIATDGSSLLLSQIDADGNTTYSIMNPDGNDLRNIPLSCSSIIAFRDNMIYYISNDPVILGRNSIDGMIGENITLLGGSLSVYSIDDDSNTQLASLLALNTNKYIDGIELRAAVVGENDLYAEYTWYSDFDGDGEYSTGETGTGASLFCSLVKINLISGDITFIHNESN